METAPHSPATRAAPPQQNQTPHPMINFYSPQEPSPIISPWGREQRTSTASLPGGGGLDSPTSGLDSPASRPTRTSLPVLGGHLAERKGTNNNNNNSRRDVTLDDALARLSSDIRSQHPFITRVQSQTACNGSSNGSTTNAATCDVINGAPLCRKPSVIVSPSQLGPGRELAMTSSHLGDDDDEDNDDNESRLHMKQQHEIQNGGERFANILTLADSNLSQAESILSSLGCGERTGLPSDSEDEEGGEGPVSLGSDIESNIRRLERTQAKINAALQTFRYRYIGKHFTLYSVQPLSGYVGSLCADPKTAKKFWYYGTVPYLF